MKQNILALGIFVMALATTAQAELKWLTDFEEGKKAVKESGKSLLVAFTGSDWCHACIQLEKEILSQKAFEAVAEKYILVKLDFPEAQDLVAPEQRVKNQTLALELQVAGFPSILIFDEKGRSFTRTGYQPLTPEEYLKHLEEITKPYNDLQSAEGEKRKDALLAFFRTLPGSEIEQNFGAEFEEFKKLDPEDKSGFVAEMAAAKALAGYEDEVGQHLAAGEFDAVITLVDDFIATHTLEGEQLQHVMMGKVMVHVERGDSEKAFAEIDKMVVVAPETEFSKNVGEVKNSITEHLKFKAKAEAEAKELQKNPPVEPSVIDEAEAAENEKAPEADAKVEVE